MATAPAFIVHDGKLEPQEDLGSLGLQEGAKLFVVSSEGNELLLRREPPQFMGMTQEEYMAGWYSLRGVMSDGIDTSDEKAREKRDEEERERRKFGD